MKKSSVLMLFSTFVLTSCARTFVPVTNQTSNETSEVESIADLENAFLLETVPPPYEGYAAPSGPSFESTDYDLLAIVLGHDPKVFKEKPRVRLKSVSSCLLVSPENIDGYLDPTYSLPRSLRRNLTLRNVGAEDCDEGPSDGLEHELDAQAPQIRDKITPVSEDQIAIERRSGKIFDAPILFEFLAPGYARDGKSAAVVYFVTPSIHISMRICKLEKSSSDKWEVAWCWNSSFV